MFCVKCNAKNEDTSTFCKNCGAKLVKTATISAGRSNTDSQSISGNLGGVQAAKPVNIVLIAGVSSKNKEKGKISNLDLTVVGEDQQPDSLKDIIAEKFTEPFQISYTLGEDLYIAVGCGEQPGGGYSVSVNAFYETEDTLVIDTTLIGPGKVGNVTDTPTRPYIVIKTKNIADKMIEFK